MKDVRARLAMMWIFLMFNYLYCDVLGLMDPTTLRQFLDGKVSGLELTDGFLLASGVLMEIPIAAVLLSWLLPHRANRWVNVVAGSVMTLVQVASLFVGTATSFYLFFSAIEITTTVLIVGTALRRWPLEAGRVPEPSPALG